METAQLKESIVRHTASCKALIAGATGGELTAADAKEAADHIAAIKQLKVRIKENETDAATSAAIGELLGGLGLGDPSIGGKAAHVGPWAKALGQKDVMYPTGSVACPSPVGTLPALTDEPLETILQVVQLERLSGTDGFSYLRETVRTHNAAVVADKAAKPTSVYTLERIDDRVHVLAHMGQPMPNHYLADVGQLGRYLDAVLREGLRLALENEIINGVGGAGNFDGLLVVGGHTFQSFNLTMLTTCRNAVTTLEMSNIQPTAWVFSPLDWEAFELTQDLGGAFMMGPAAGGAPIVPIDRAKRRLWGLRVALSTQIAQGTAILADFTGSVRLYERDQTTVTWSNATYDTGTGKTDFERNLIRWLAEGRWGWATLRPSGIVEIDLGTSPGT